MRASPGCRLRSSGLRFWYDRVPVARMSAAICGQAAHVPATRSALLLDRKIPRAYELAPFLRLLLDELGKRFRRACHGLEHLRRQELLRERLIHQNARECAVDLEHDVARGARGGKQSKPGAG